MRPVGHWFTVCVIILLKNDASTTAGRTQTNGPAFNLVTGPSRLETNALATPSFTKPHNSAVEVIDHDLQNDEDRGLEPAASSVADIVERLEEYILQGIHPAHAFEVLNLRVGEKENSIIKKLEQWIVYAYKYHDLYKTFDDDAIVKHLLVSIGGEKQLANFLRALRRTSGMEDRALTLQRKLFEQLGAEKMFPVWDELYIDTCDVYHMMPIALEDVLTSNVKEAATWPAVRQKLIEFIEHVILYYGEELFYGETIAYNEVMELRGSEELLQLVSTPLPSNLQQYAQRWQELLYKEVPKTRSRISKIWLDLGKSPADVYSCMIRISAKRLKSDVEKEADWVTVRGMIKEWFDFTDKFFDRSIVFSSGNAKDRLLEAFDNIAEDQAMTAQQSDVVATLQNDKVILLLLDSMNIELPGSEGLRCSVEGQDSSYAREVQGYSSAALGKENTF